MLKFGVCTLAQLDRSSPSLLAETRRYFRRFCNVELYEALAQRGKPGDDSLQAAVIDLFPIANGAFKRTSSKRFESFDRAVVDCLSEMFGASGRLAVHDMAVSDGRTACEVYHALAARFGAALDFVATDLCVRVTALSREGSRLSVIIDEDGVPLQLIWPPFVLPLAVTESWLYPVNRALRRLLRREARALFQAAEKELPGVRRQEIVLMCSEARKLASANSNFRVERYDIFEPAPRPYRVVRAMNVFNPSYFQPMQLARGIANVHASLAEGGAFVIGSNGESGSTVNGGVYRKHGDVFVEVLRCGAGAAVAPQLTMNACAMSGAKSTAIDADEPWNIENAVQ